MSREKRMMNRKESNTKNNRKIGNIIAKDEVPNIVSNKKLLITMIITVLVLVTLLSGSFAIFMRSGESDKKDLYESGTLIVQLDDEKEGDAIDLNPTKPISDEYGMATVEPYTFTITNTGTTYASYEVYLDETIENNKLKDEEVRKYIRYQIDDESPRSLYGQGSNIIVRGGIGPEDSLEFKLKLWVDIDAPNDMEGTTYKAKVSVKGKSTNKMQPNGPELVDGLIPVLYDEKNDTWVKADTSTAWYNYEKQEWANAVTVTGDKRETYLSNEAGTPINMEDINTMWVWIPRYKYRIPSDMGATDDILNPPEIDVIFESRYNATGKAESEYRAKIVDGVLTDTEEERFYYTHPAFRDGKVAKNTDEYDVGGWDRELTGIWVAKFETGTNTASCNNNPSEENCKNVTPIIIPNTKSLRYQNVSTEFKTALKFGEGTLDDITGKVTFASNLNNTYGFNIKNNMVNTHMMKATEWGVVAFLSQSRYGKMGNKNYNITDKEIYRNDSSDYYVGRSKGVLINGYSSAGSYAYNDKKCLSTDTTKCSGEKEKYKGTGASTSGTIYGVYDMSGGTYEYVMGIYENSVYSSGFTILPERKYYDFQKGYILGDISWETRGWYSDYKAYNSWSVYGGVHYDPTTWSGIFDSWNQSGSFVNVLSFRVTLIP